MFRWSSEHRFLVFAIGKLETKGLAFLPESLLAAFSYQFTSPFARSLSDPGKQAVLSSVISLKFYNVD